MRKRLLFGSLLAAAALLVVVVDAWLVPWYPFSLLLFWWASHILCAELLALLPAHSPRPRRWLCHTGIAALVLAGWLPRAFPELALQLPPWQWLLGTFTGYVLSVFLTEMARYHEPGGVVIRTALATWLVAYVGLLPAFLGQLRWLGATAAEGTTALLLTIFVPKCCDIGAYFTGKLLGRTRMTPRLSPRKTWEGAAGGLTLAVVAAILIDQVGYLLNGVALLQRCWWAEIGFGASVGIAGMLGDLAESMIKRDCGQKDAGQGVPGFGGLLDVADAVLFAAPVAALWFWGLGTR